MGHRWSHAHLIDDRFPRRAGRLTALGAFGGALVAGAVLLAQAPPSTPGPAAEPPAPGVTPAPAAAPPASPAPVAPPFTAVRRDRAPEAGVPFVRTYRPSDIGADSQNWAFAQDRRGLLYVGTAAGVAQYDGATWRIMETPGLSVVRSLDIAADGTIYVGSSGEFGRLALDEHGAYRYASLRDRLPADAPFFSDVWRTFVTADGVVFQTEQAIFILRGDSLRIVRPTTRFHRAALVDGRLYLATPELGLAWLDGDTLRGLPGTARLSQESVPIILPYGEGALLIGTRADGLFVYDGTTLTSLPTNVDLADAWPYRGIVLADGTFALATVRAGVLVFDRAGGLVLRVDRRAGLPSDRTYALLADREGGLWVTGEEGIARIEYPSAASLMNLGVLGFVSDIERVDGRLYLAGSGGAAVLQPATATEPAQVRMVATNVGQCWALDRLPGAAPESNEVLVIACTDGLYAFQEDGLTRLVPNVPAVFRPNAITPSRLDPTRVWVGLADGLSSIRLVAGRWEAEARLPGVDGRVVTIVEAEDGTLWFSGEGQGVGRVTFGEQPAAGHPRPASTLREYTEQDGLTAGIYVTPVLVDGRLLVLPDGSDGAPRVTRYDPATDRFVDELAVDVPVNRLRRASGMVRTRDGRFFANFGRGTYLLQRDDDGRWSVDRSAFAKFGTMATGFADVEADGVAWVESTQGLIRFDLAQAVSTIPPFDVQLRRVATGHGRVLYGGDGPLPDAPPQLPASTESLRFEYAAPSFVNEGTTEYQTRIEGLETDWSAWTTETRREVMNLPFGTYGFHVRARGAMGQQADSQVFALRVMPPWHRTWWAYTVYALGLLLLGLASVRTVRKRAIARERQRAQFAEARLRAEAAEQLARSEADGKKQVELLSDIGREITASLDMDTIFGRLYERINQLADADVFGVGLYDPARQVIEYQLAIEDGKRYAPYARDASDPDQLPVWSITHRAPVLINDLATEYQQYVRRYEEPGRTLEDGTLSRAPQSLIYVPLIAKDRVLGVVTIQSFEKGAYDAHHLNVLQSLASYAAVALDNAGAYRQLNEQEHEIRRLFEDAERARAAAEEADAAKSAFLSTVSHELRTPLTSVLGFAKIIKRRLEERIFPLVPTDDRKVAQTVQQVTDNLQVVVSEGERLTKLIDDVLDLAKIEAGKLEWHMADVSVAEVIDHATAATSSLFEQKGLRLVREVAPDLPTVTGDRDRLVQVVINLISNAVKFTDRGDITCRALQRGGDLVVSVQDMGVGIAPADQPKVFERFKQVGDTLTDKPKGTGLGLPICKEIVEHHGGRIWVESVPGEGSTFSFTVPLAADAIGAGAGSDTPVALAALIRQLRDQVVVTTPRTGDRAPRILVVDDEANIRELLTQEFAEAGYVVATAANGREAVARVRTDRPDLIVLDVMMPEMNGFDVAAVLKNDPTTHDIPIVILSIVQDRERGYRIGVDRYLTKPIDTDLLFREVGTLLEQKTSHKRVLVVDEDSSTIRTLTDVLSARGYSVVDAQGADLVERAIAVQPDIILLNAVSSANSHAVRMLRFEKGLENVLFLVYQ